MTVANEEKERLFRQNLFLLELNFNALEPKTRRAYKRFEPPTAEEIVEYKNQHGDEHPKLAEMLKGDAAMRLYAAILLGEIDNSKSAEILRELEKDSAPVKIQNPVGHGFSEIPVKYAAQSFRQHGDIRKGFAEKNETLAKWKTAVEHEARKKNIAFDEKRLPTAEAIYEALSDAAEIQKISDAAASLADDPIIAARFYAAAVLEEIDRAAALRILENLRKEETPVLIFFGDITHEIPASEIAAALIANNSPEALNAGVESKDFASSLLNSLKKFFSGGNRF